MDRMNASSWLSTPAPNDYTALSMVDITFDPSGPTVVCVNVTIIRDQLVEEDFESFSFVISPNQTDEAVQLLPPFDRSSILIADADGNFIRPSWN